MIRSGTFYWVVCDRCGANNGEGDYDRALFESDGEAVGRAEDSLWLQLDGSLFCADCAEKIPGGLCVTCSEPEDWHPVAGCTGYVDPGDTDDV
jgi:hypothetical protein